MSKAAPSPSGVLTAVSPGDDRGDRTRALDWGLTIRLAKQMALHPRLFWWIMFLAFVLAALNGSIPFVLTETIRLAIENNTAQPTDPPPSGLWVGVSVIVGLALTWYVAMRLRQYAVNDLAERVVHDLRASIFDHLQSLGLDFYDRTKVGRILARGTSDIMAIRNAILSVAPRMTIAVIQMLYALAIMVYYDVVLGSIVIGIAPVLYAVNWKFRQKLSSSYRLVQESFSIITANLAESIAGMRVTQAFVRDARNTKMFRRLCLTHRDRNMTTARAHALYIPMLDIASQIFIAIALLVGCTRVESGAMSVTDLLGFMIMTGVFFQPITVLGDMYNLSLQAMAGAERVYALLDTEPTTLDPEDHDAVTLTRTSDGMHVQFDNVSFAYIDDQFVLRDISFEAKRGQTVAIVGHTGSGKTSIINLLAKFYDHQEGTILLDGHDSRLIRQSDLHAQTGIVLQENFLFTGSVMDNIRFARPDATDEMVIETCQRLGCLDILERLPDGLHTEVGERGESLSLGQRQLACFARAMLADPRMIILDEATSAIDTVTEARVQTSLERLLEGRTSFVVAHRLSTIRDADQILVIDHGRIVERGTHQELLENGAVYGELYAEFVRLSEGDDPADQAG